MPVPSSLGVQRRVRAFSVESLRAAPGSGVQRQAPASSFDPPRSGPPAQSLEDLVWKRAGGIEICEVPAQAFPRAPADLHPAIGEECLHRAVTERERIGHPEGLGIPTQVVEFEPEQVVEFEPERVARNALSDRDREFDEEVVE